jgi:hypothetical protein
MANFDSIFNGRPPAESNTKLYNNQKYQLDIIFDNSQGNQFQLDLASMVTLDIEEDTRCWYKKASLVIRNPQNIFEQKVFSNANLNQYYKFRNDGRDIVYIRFRIIEDSAILSTNAKIDYNTWGMQYKFVVYDREDIPGETPLTKQLKLYLWEFDHQILQETNLLWSTNELLPSDINPAYATDDQKQVPTGSAIKSVITKGLQKYGAQTFTSEWDVGSSKIFYTAPANYTGADTIEYLLKKHVSSQVGTDGGADPCILSRTRYDNDWKLISYTNFFSKAIEMKGPIATAGPLQREIITLSLPGGDDSATYLYNLQISPSTSKSYFSNFKDPVTSNIRNIHFTDMSPLDSARDMIHTPCYSNDLKNKIFELDFSNNDIQNVKKFVNTNYANKLKINSTPDTLITLNKTKTDALALKNIYSYSTDKLGRFAEGRNFLLTSALYYNTSLSFTAFGSPIREAGTFISIETDVGGVRDEFFNKLFGQWMVYNVVHSFSEGDYTNNVTALRVHANDNIDIKSNIT